jgi:leader peptidase (prepilin peptidase)/N-methyltransferase
LAAAALTAAILLPLRKVFVRRMGDPGLGLGDVKLVAALALWLGPATPTMAVLACVLGLAVAVWRRVPRGQAMALGPMIAVAGMTVGMLAERGALPWAR